MGEDFPRQLLKFPTNGIPVNFVPAKTGEVIQLGPITCRVLEDGSRTGKLKSK